jgi:hypothetical protein
VAAHEADQRLGLARIGTAPQERTAHKSLLVIQSLFDSLSIATAGNFTNCSVLLLLLEVQKGGKNLLRSRTARPQKPVSTATDHYKIRLCHLSTLQW